MSKRKRPGLTPLEGPDGELVEIEPPQKKTGRPSKRYMPVDREQVFLRAVSLGIPQKASAEIVGVDEGTVVRWKREDEAFRMRVAEARACAIRKLAIRAWKLTTAESEQVQFRATKWLLSVMEPEFRQTNKVELDLVDDDGSLPDPAYC